MKTRFSKLGILRKGLILGLTAALSCVSPLTVLAYNNDTSDETGQCTLSLNYGDESLPISNAVFHLYKVADIDGDIDGDFPGDISFDVTADFEEAGVLLEPDTTDNWYSAAVTLETYVIERKCIGNPVKSAADGTTDENGRLKFDNIEKGLYLLIGDAHEIDDRNVYPLAELITLPYKQDSGELDYNPTINIKYQSFFDITTTDETTDLHVQKIWDDEGNSEDRPKEVTVSLYDDGALYDTVVLNEENNWIYTWEDLDANCRWQLTEINVPDNYTMTSVLNRTLFTVTNTYTPSEDNNNPDDPEHSNNPDTPESPSIPDEPESPSNPDTPSITTTVTPENPDTTTTTTSKPETPSDSTTSQPSTPSVVTQTPSTPSSSGYLPQTGSLWWPVPLLSAGGLALITIGWGLNKRKDDKNKK
jgi:hypothetical protein